MTKGLVAAILLFATLFLIAHSARVTLTEDLQLQHNIDWYKGQTCGSPFLYDRNFEGPGNVPAAFTTLAQTIADNLYSTGSDSTNLANFVTAQGCNFHQFISQVELSSVGVNIHQEVVNIHYSGSLAQLGKTLLNNDEFNRVRRCPRYDNYAFGLRIDNTTNPETIHFVILALASNPTSLCSGTTVLTPASPYLCGSTCNHVAGVTGDVTYIPTPTKVEESYIESNEDIFLWREAEQVLENDITVDLYSLGQGQKTFATPMDNNIVSVTPADNDPSATILAGTHVVSWFLKFDPVGTTLPTPTQTKGSVVFSTPIIGAIFTQQKPVNSRTRLEDTDPTFSTLCVPYNNDDNAGGINNINIFRGLEYSTVLKTSEGFTIKNNVFTVNNFEAKQRGVDNVRIFTTCPYGPACDVAITPILNITVVHPPPIRVTPGFLQSVGNVFVFRERRWITSAPLTVDRVVPSYPDNYLIQFPPAVGADPTLPAGLAVTSWYFHAEPTPGTFTNYTAAASFKDQIKAYIFRAVNPPQNAGHETLLNTDALFGDHCTAYGPGFTGPGSAQTFRGLEFTTADSLNVDATGYRLDVILRVTNGQDDFRVLTLCDS